MSERKRRKMHSYLVTLKEEGQKGEITTRFWSEDEVDEVIRQWDLFVQILDWRGKRERKGASDAE